MPRHLLGRFYLAAGILAAEAFLRSSIPHSESLLGPLTAFGIVFFAVFVGLGHGRLRELQAPLLLNRSLLGAHAACVTLVSLASLAAVHGYGAWFSSFSALIAARAITMLGIALLALACVPARTWARMLRRTGWLWAYAALAAALACALRSPLQAVWSDENSAPGRFLQRIAFDAVRWVLHFFLANVQVDPVRFRIGTDHFNVIIAQACSGMEGLGLVLVFTVLWLGYLRKEMRFPHALLLVPCALLSVWALNIARICALVLIGNAGEPDVAMIGFHSQAGWIAFTGVALAFSVATRNLRWVRRRSAIVSLSNAEVMRALKRRPSLQPAPEEMAGESPATAAYLVPFLAILAASFVSKAASGSFEWLYPLRFIAALVALWLFRGELKKLDWRFGWVGPVAGVGVFFVWLAPTFWGLWHGVGLAEDGALADGLAGLPTAGRLVWIGFRVAAAAVTVPIAEELAFRGYLARRLVGTESGRAFELIPFSGLTLVSIAVSSVVFGLMHGHDWFVGILAGLAYAFVAKWRGRIGEAVVAHATTNLLLAVWVLSRGDWAQW